MKVLKVDNIDSIYNAVNEANSRGVNLSNMAFGYGRVSTTKAEQETSIEDQVSDIKRYAESKGLHLVHIFDETASAYRGERQQFNLMLDLVEETGIQNLIVKDQSRVHRNLYDRIQISDILKKEKLNIHYYLSGEIVDHSTDEFTDDLMAVLHKKYSDDLGKRVKRAHMNKAVNRGLAIALPMGYKWDKEAGEHIINEDEQEIIRYLFHLYDNEGYNIVDTAKMLNARGYKSKKGLQFKKSTVHSLLKNKSYAGYYRYKGKWYKGDHTPYITLDEFESRMKKMEMKFNGHKKGDTNYLFKKLVSCSYCGRILSGFKPRKNKTKPDPVYYGHKCDEFDNDHKVIRESDILTFLDQKINHIAYSEEYTEFLKDLFKRSARARDNVAERERSAINKDIKKLEDQKLRLLDLYIDPKLNFSKDDLDKKSEEIQGKIDILFDRLKTLSKDLSGHHHKVLDIIQYLREFSAEYLRSSDEDKILFLRKMSDGIVANENFVEILWKPSFQYLLDDTIVGIIPPSSGNDDIVKYTRGSR